MTTLEHNNDIPIEPDNAETTKNLSDAGVILYSLSDKSFIDKGWTKLPVEKRVRKQHIYKLRPAHPELDWFISHKNEKLIKYDTGEKFAEFDENGGGRLYYKNGRLALDYYHAEETNVQQRLVVYSDGGGGSTVTVLAMFDYLGNGVVFDHSGKIRLKYNQTEGVVLDRKLGPESHWTWHSLNDTPELLKVMTEYDNSELEPVLSRFVDEDKMSYCKNEINNRDKNEKKNDKTQRSRIDIHELDINKVKEDMIAIEKENSAKIRNKKFKEFQSYQITLKALKINRCFSLRVLDQRTIILIFGEGAKNLRINLGLEIDRDGAVGKLVGTENVVEGEVLCSVEQKPAKSESMERLQRIISQAQKINPLRCRLPPVPKASIDRFDTFLSKPLRPLPAATSTVNTNSFMHTCSHLKLNPRSRNCIKKLSSNIFLYYNSRL